MTLLLVNTFPSWVLALGVVAACVAFAIFVTWYGRRFLGKDVREGHNDVGGMIMQTVGGVYAVLLALVVISLWDQRSAIDDNASAEAGFLVATFRDVGGLPPEFATEARAKIVAYTQSVVSVGYPALSAGGASDATRQTYSEMFAKLRAFEPKTRHDEMLFAEALRELNQSSESRTKRLEAVRGGLPPVFWAVLVVSTALALLLGGLLSMENARHHYVFMAAFAASIGVLLFLVVVLDRPFSGDLGLTADPYEEALDAMKAAR
jgi:hypothetical protein